MECKTRPEVGDLITFRAWEAQDFLGAGDSAKGRGIVRLASMAGELQLLLASARVTTTREAGATIRQLLDEGVDWTMFVRKALDHELAGLVGHTLDRVASDLVPGDILEAFRAILDQTRKGNQALFDELAGVIDALADNGVEAIAYRGPVLALEAFGDLGLRVFRNLDFLVRAFDLAPTIATLHTLGYERKGELTAVQFDLIHRLKGQEIIFKQAGETAVQPHTRLAHLNMALDIDYGALWRRAERTTLNGRTMLTLAPEDNVLVLAIHGGMEGWWNIKRACDLAAFIGSRPNLDWIAIVERARAQGCVRTVLLAISLACKYFGSTVPDAIAAAARADPEIEPMVGRISAHWQEPIGRPSNKTLSMDRLRLHDGMVRRARYIARASLLPGAQHVAAMALPRGLGFAYVPFKIAYAVRAMPPLWRNFWQTLLPLRRASPETRRSEQEYQKVREDAELALAANPNNAAALRRLGNALFVLKRYAEAVACYDKALAIVPDNRNLWKDRAAAIRTAQKNVRSFNVVDPLPLVPQNATEWVRYAGLLSASERYGEAVAASDRALAIDPNHEFAMSIGIRSRIYACDWSRREADKWQIIENLKAGRAIIRPFNHRLICDSEPENLAIARLFSRQFSQTPTPRVGRGSRSGQDRIRIAYLSPDFGNRAASILMAGVFEHHDRTRFETAAISFAPDDKSELRARLETAFDHFIDVQVMGDSAVATMMREMEIDIAIDLNSHGGSSRPGILAHRPAPVQVSYLNEGTTGASYIDYIIADATVIPADRLGFYSERVVYLPNCFLCADSRRYLPDRTPSRVQVKLPNEAFVYCCFCNTNRIAPPVFDVWMRVMTACPRSVLWLVGDNSDALRNLRREAQSHGVAPKRLIFAPRVPLDDYLAQIRLADLFLDTLPYNAHTTASDALWVGLPMLTCLGNTFAGRVAASLLNAIGLPELVTSSLEEYEQLAIALACEPERLGALRTKLIHNRDTHPLFDTARFTHDLESAYIAMWERERAGLRPSTIVVVGTQPISNSARVQTEGGGP